LDTIYLKDWRHVGYFYINRFLRLMPLYAVVAGLTYVFLLLSRGGLGFVIDPRDPPYNFIHPAKWTDDHLISKEIVLGGHVFLAPVPGVTFGPVLIPQEWSIGVELCFYLIAPAAVWLSRRRLSYLLPFLAASAALFVFGAIQSPEPGFMDQFVYKNFLASVFMFLLGGVMHFVTRRVSWRLDFKWLLVLLVGWGYYVWYDSASPLLGAREPSAAIQAANLLLAIPATLLVVFCKIPA